MKSGPQTSFTTAEITEQEDAEMKVTDSAQRKKRDYSGHPDRS